MLFLQRQGAGILFPVRVGSHTVILFLWRWKTLILNTLLIQPLQWQIYCTVMRMINSIYLTTRMSQVRLLVKVCNLVRIFSPLCCMVVDCSSLFTVQYPTGVVLHQWTQTMRIHNCVNLLLVIFTSTCEKLRWLILLHRTVLVYASEANTYCVYHKMLLVMFKVYTTPIC